MASSFREQKDVPDAEKFSCAATLLGHTGTVTGVKFAPDGTKFASASADSTARMWDVERGVELVVVDVKQDLCGEDRPFGAITGVDVNRDGVTFVTSSDDRKARLWDTRAPRAPVQVYVGHTDAVSTCSFAPNGSTIATGSFDETVRLWEQRTGTCDAIIPAHVQPVMCVQFSKGSVRPKFATASMDGTCRIWSSHTRECLRTIVPTNDKGERAPVASVRFTPNNQYVMMNSLHNKILLFDPMIGGTSGAGATANAALQVEQEDDSGGKDTAVLPQLKKTYEGHLNTRMNTKSVFMTRCSDGAKLVLSGSEDHHVYVWSLNSRELVGVLRGVTTHTDAMGSGSGGKHVGHSDSVLGIDASEVAPIVATGGKDNLVKVWKRA